MATGNCGIEKNKPWMSLSMPYYIKNPKDCETLLVLVLCLHFSYKKWCPLEDLLLQERGRREGGGWRILSVLCTLYESKKAQDEYFWNSRVNESVVIETAIVVSSPDK